MAAVATHPEPPVDELQDRCEATTARTGKPCPHYGWFDPVAGEFRCRYHETREEAA